MTRSPRLSAWRKGLRCPFGVEIVSQDRLVFEGDVDILVAPGTDGEMGILPHHAPLLTTLKPGVLRVRTAAQEEVFAISGGVMEVRPTIVTVLADAAERADEIDISRAEEARQRAEESLRSWRAAQLGSLPGGRGRAAPLGPAPASGAPPPPQCSRASITAIGAVRPPWPLFSKELGIDLGTVNTLVCENGEIVLHEPTVVAIATAEAKIVASARRRATCTAARPIASKSCAPCAMASSPTTKSPKSCSNTSSPKFAAPSACSGRT